MEHAVTFIYLNQEEVISTGIDMAKTVDIIEKLLGLQEEKKVIMPSKVILDLGERERGRINGLSAYVGGEFEICGIKWISGFPGNPRNHGIPRAHALIVLNDAETGVPLAVMDGTYISAMRTGAVTGVGAKYLANPTSTSVGMIGCGVQSRTQIMALKVALPCLELIRAYDLQKGISQKFAAWASSSLGVKAESVNSPREAVEGSDVIVTATTADEPIVKDPWLKQGSFFAHVGSYQEEENDVILKSDKVVVDNWEEVLHRKTPLLAKLYEEGKIDDSRIHGNLGEIILGVKRGRENKTERIFFSPLGMGSEDIAVASVVYQEAKQKGIGQILKLWDQPAIEG